MALLGSRAERDQPPNVTVGGRPAVTLPRPEVQKVVALQDDLFPAHRDAHGWAQVEEHRGPLGGSARAVCPTLLLENARSLHGPIFRQAARPDLPAGVDGKRAG